MRFLALIVALFFTTPAFAAPIKYAFDQSHTYIQFHISHLGYSTTIGLLTKYDGTVMFDEKNPENSSVEISFDPKGIRTISEKLDEHLQDASFFNTEKFPTVTFKSTNVHVTKDQMADVTGDLTLLGVTKPVVLKMKLNKMGIHPMQNKKSLGFSGEAMLKRSDFGMDKHIPAIGDDVKITIETELLDAADNGTVKH